MAHKKAGGSSRNGRDSNSKRLGVKKKGWEEVAAPFSDDTPRSVADIDSREAFDRVRAFKKEMKAKGKDKAD